MYTIGQVAARTGLSVATVRAWERRYGVVTPPRTPAGYRLFDDASIGRLIAMRRLVAEQGWQPRQAAQRVLEGGGDLEALIGPQPGIERPPTTSSGASSSGGLISDASPPLIGRDTALVEAFVSAAGDLDVPAMERVLDDGFASQRFELTIDTVVAPALRAIGAAWAAGEIDVGAEHAASETVRRRLARFFDAAGRLDPRPQVIVGLPPHSHHEIGAFAFAVAARRAGMGVLYLGANVPVESWVLTVQETTASVVVLGIVTASDVVSALAVVRAMAALANPPTCLVGGASAVELVDAAPTSTLPATLDASVAAVARVLLTSLAGRSTR